VSLDFLGSNDLLSFLALVMVLSGFVKGVIGLGFAAVGVGMLGLVMAPAHAAALLVVPATVTNVWQLWAGPDFRGLLRRLWPMLVCIVLGGWLASGSLSGAHSGRGRFYLGAVLAIYAVIGLIGRRPSVPARAEIWLGPVVGVLTGVVTAMTGVFMIPVVPYLGGLGLDREDMIQALGLSFTVATFSLAADLAGAGVFDRHLMLMSVLALVPTAIGMQAGEYLRARISAVLFRRCFFFGMLVLGLELARH
jgi:uncharacterized membrane protein YfcA